MKFIMKSLKAHPCCPHGPTLMFERCSSDGEKTGRRFYACSACRARSNCGFFHWVDETFSSTRTQYWQHKNNNCHPTFTHEECIRRLQQFKSISVQNRMFCKTCSVIVLPGEEILHSNDELIPNVDLERQMPSSLLTALENNKIEAQYFFTEKTVSFLIKQCKDLGFSRVVSIGTPRVHEYIIANNMGLSSMLLDIDYRYMQFYNDKQFCHYNLFNNCFFGGVPAKETFKKFLCQDQGNGLVILMDPPFGGLVDAISYTLQKICSWWMKGCKRDIGEVPIILFFPYFTERRIVESLPSLKMMDYKVEYGNHKRFQKRKQGSPVRIYTNIKPALFVLPEEEGYRFCDICERYVGEENLHCPACKACTTKNGKTYSHCNKCQRCNKSTYEHCDTCKKCTFPTHVCEEASQRLTCYFCSEVGHKKANCPLKLEMTPKKKRKLN